MHLLRQVTFIHVSDMHFGRNHVCAPDAADGAVAGIPELGNLIQDDVAEVLSHLQDSGVTRPSTPTYFAATGDLTETASVASSDEFTKAKRFLLQLTQDRTTQSALNHFFVVPGNHDVVFDQPDPARRWQPFCAFYSELFKSHRRTVLDRDAHELTQVHDRSAEGLVVAEINSAFYVRKGSIDASRGQVDASAIARLRTQLSAIDKTARDHSIRVALMHHHPVLLPSLVEPGLGYDAILNSHALLRLLQDFGFHVVLHGHKHYPQTFSYDPDYAWSTKPAAPPILVVAGGSAGSIDLPKGTRATNCYNVITIKWHPDAQQARVRVETRGLKRIGDDAPLAPDLWEWETLAVSDRVLRPMSGIPQPRGTEPAPVQVSDRERSGRYLAQRGNMAVAEVMPALADGQAYEVRVWLVGHRRKAEDVPVEVVWNAGPKFRQVRVSRSTDDSFCTGFSYWDSMLVEALMTFADGKQASAFVYARVPTVR